MLVNSFKTISASFFLLFIFSFFLFTRNELQILSDELSLEDEIKEAFKDYPFKCNPEGSTPEMAACAWIELIKSDRDLKKELNDEIITIGVGDNENDIEMIKYAGIGVSYFGKAALSRVADISFNNTSLLGLLYVQGYSDNDIIN